MLLLPLGFVFPLKSDLSCSGFCFACSARGAGKPVTTMCSAAAFGAARHCKCSLSAEQMVDDSSSNTAQPEVSPT